MKQLVVKLEEKGFCEDTKGSIEWEEKPDRTHPQDEVFCRKVQGKKEQFLNGLLRGIRTEDLRKAVSVFLKMQENMECMSD